MTARQAIEALARALEAAWNRHDAQAFAAVFAEDAEFTNVFGMVQQGRAGIEAAHAAVFKTMFQDSRLAVTETRVRLIRPDIAAVDVNWTMTGARDPHGNPWPERTGLMNWIVTRHGERWLVDVSHNMDLPSPDLAKAQAALSKSEEARPTDQTPRWRSRSSIVRSPGSPVQTLTPFSRMTARLAIGSSSASALSTTRID
jgi:uncharacterized protein (TIGR02246 family)